MRVILAVAGLMLTVPAMAAARTPAPPSPMVDAARVHEESPPVGRKITLGGLNLDPGALALADIRAAVGAGMVDEIGSSGVRLNWLCYDLPQSRTRLWLSREGSASMATLAVATSDANCAVLPAKFQSVTVDGVATLGMPRAALVEKLGKPGLEAGDWMVFRNGQRWLTVRLEQGRVAALWTGGS